MAEEVKNQEDELVEEDVVEEEEVEEEEGEGGSFFEKYRRFIFLGAGVIILVSAWYFLRGGDSEKKNEDGQIALINPVYLYEANLAGQAPDSLMSQILAGPNSLSSIAEDAKGTNAGNLATLYLGTLLLRMGQIDQAILKLEEVDKGSNLLSASAYSALASAYEEKKNWDKAAANFELAASTPEETESLTPYYLKQAGRVYESAGNKEKALEVYKKIKTNYPNSEDSKDIDKYIGRCEGNSGGE